MRLEWAALALADREAIFDHIIKDSPRAAIAMDERIEDGVEVLPTFPESGRPGRVKGTRELVVSGTSYIVAYAVAGDVVRILRVLHMSRMWPDEMS